MMKISASVVLCGALVVVLCGDTVAIATPVVQGDVRTRVALYPHKDRIAEDAVIADTRADLSVTHATDAATAKVAVRAGADTTGVAQGAAWDNTDGGHLLLSVREAYIDVDGSRTLDGLNVAVGKKIMESVVRFDAVDFNPLARRDQSEPFSIMDNDVADGVVMASVTLPLTERHTLYGQCVVAGRTTPLLATHRNDRWARQVPGGMRYGDPETDADVNYLCRMFYQGSDGSMVEAAVFHGAAAGVDRVESRGVTLRPIFPTETSGFIAGQMPIGTWTARLGCSVHAQSGADDFGTCVAEAERIWQFRSGVSLFVEMGYSTAFTTRKSGGSMPTLDLRRALDNHITTSVEYSPRQGHFYRARGAYGLQDGDMIFRLEAEYLLDTVFMQSAAAWLVKGTSLLVRAEHVRAGGGQGDVFDAHEDDDRIVLIVRKTF